MGYQGEVNTGVCVCVCVPFCFVPTGYCLSYTKDYVTKRMEQHF